MPRGDVPLVREAIPGHGSQVRGRMTCAALASYLPGRKYWVWTPHGLYKLLLREPGVCRVDVSVLLGSDLASLAAPGTRVVAACSTCAPGVPRPPGAPKPFCMNCGRDLTPGWGDKVRAQRRGGLAESVRWGKTGTSGMEQADMKQSQDPQAKARAVESRWSSGRRIMPALSTPLASIFGSGFLVIVPVLASSVGPYSVWAMLAVAFVAFHIGAIVRHNILCAEPVLAAGSQRVTLVLERLSDGALVAAYVVSVCLYIHISGYFAITL